MSGMKFKNLKYHLSRLMPNRDGTFECAINDFTWGVFQCKSEASGD